MAVVLFAFIVIMIVVDVLIEPDPITRRPRLRRSRH